MKKVTAIILTLVLTIASMTGCNAATDTASNKDWVTVIMKIDDPIMTVNGVESQIDPDAGTAPIVRSDRTLVPIRAIIEAFGGTVSWNEAKQEVLLLLSGDTITLTIDSTTAYFNGTENVLDVAPTIMNARTMLPIRFIAESFGLNVDWNGSSQTITITQSPLPHTSEPPISNTTDMQISVSDSAHTVIFLLNNSSASKALYDQLPLTIGVEDYSTNEKIFYPPERLDISDTPATQVGTAALAYYEPWGDVVMYFDSFSAYGGLYELGSVVSGSEFIKELSGTINIKKVSELNSGAVQPNIDATDANDGMINITVTIGSQSFEAKLHDNDATQQLVKRFPMTINMDEMNGNEKYHYIDGSLPTDSNRPDMINTGDIMLYGNNCIVIFYKSFTTSYSYTRLGYIDNPNGLADALGSSSATVRFELK